MSSINKTEVLTRLLSKLEEDLEIATKVAKDAHEHAINDELVQEDKHDTRRIEASYLAGALKKRKEELERDLGILRELKQINSNNATFGSVVKVLDLTSKKAAFYFLSPSIGGIKLLIENQEIGILSVHSPLGSELIDLEVNEIFEVEISGINKEFQVLEIF